jgi:hypothetical protein
MQWTLTAKKFSVLSCFWLEPSGTACPVFAAAFATRRTCALHLRGISFVFTFVQMPAQKWHSLAPSFFFFFFESAFHIHPYYVYTIHKQDDCAT